MGVKRWAAYVVNNYGALMFAGRFETYAEALKASGDRTRIKKLKTI